LVGSSVDGENAVTARKLVGVAVDVAVIVAVLVAVGVSVKVAVDV